MPETQVPSLGWEDPSEKKMATHSNILAWEIPWTGEPGRLQLLGSQESDKTLHLYNYIADLECWIAETVSDFFGGGSKITADGDCSHEMKIRLLLGRKVMSNLDSILKSIDISLPTKVCLVKAMVFPVVMYGCESWTMKKAKCRRIDAFELRCWRRLLRVPWTARRSNQSILKEISPGISLEGMMLKLKLQYFGHLMGRVDSLEKTLMLGGIGGRRRRGRDGWMASLTRWT